MDCYGFINGKIVMPLLCRLMNRNHFQYLPKLAMINAGPIEKIRDYQFSAVRDMVTNAYQNVPFYKGEWTRSGFSPSQLNSLEDMCKIPFLTKKLIRNNQASLLSVKRGGEKLITRGTGGTTDSPIEIKYSRGRQNFKTAEMYHFREWWDWKLGDKVSYLWGAPQDIPDHNSFKYRIINKIAGRRQFLFSSLLDDRILSDFVKKINRFSPGVLQGYSNSVAILAKYILETNTRIHSPKSVVLAAEPVSPEQKQAIRKAFHCDVFSMYGCREAGYMGMECKEHDGYHINCSGLYIEIINDQNKPAEPGEIGSIVYTDLLNFSMPFIRYRLGDMGMMVDKPCKCGSALPLMSFMAGRQTDVFKAPDGTLIPGASLTSRIVEDSRGIEQLQIVQEKIDELDVKIVKGKAFSENDITRLDVKLYGYFKDHFKINKMFVASIPKSKSGKTMFCVSYIDK